MKCYVCQHVYDQTPDGKCPNCGSMVLMQDEYNIVDSASKQFEKKATKKPKSPKPKKPQVEKDQNQQTTTTTSTVVDDFEIFDELRPPVVSDGKKTSTKTQNSAPNMVGTEWPTFCGSFSGLTTRPYSVEPYPEGLSVRDVGLKGSLEFALRGDLFDAEGNLYSKSAHNCVKKYATEYGFIDKANCILQANIVSNLALSKGFVYAMLDSGNLAKIDCQKMTATYINIKELAEKRFAGIDFQPPKTLVFDQNNMLFCSVNNLYRYQLDSETDNLHIISFRDTRLTDTAVVGNQDIFVVSEKCEIHKIPISHIIDSSVFETTEENTATYYRKGFKVPKALVFEANCLHFRLQSIDADKNQIYYVNLRQFPRGDAYLVANDTCSARLLLPCVIGEKVYVAANAFYRKTITSSLHCDEKPNTTCSRACQTIPAGCDSCLVPPILYYDDGIGKIGHDFYPGLIGFANQRVSMFQILNIHGHDKLFLITAVYKDYFAARSNDNNVYILERKPNNG